jgi:hypothetical protein
MAAAGVAGDFSLSLFLMAELVMRPFRLQSESALALAIAVKRIAPALHRQAGCRPLRDSVGSNPTTRHSRAGLSYSAASRLEDRPQNRPEVESSSATGYRKGPSNHAAFPAPGGRGGARWSDGGWEVPSSYRDYLGNLGFCYGIFRDITPIAAGRLWAGSSVVSRPGFLPYDGWRRAQ